MVPVHLDPAQVSIALAGRGRLTLRRLEWLAGLGVATPVWSDRPEPDLAAAAADRLIPRLPTGEDFATMQVLWVADLPDDLSSRIADAARAARVLVNVEDVLPLCDFHTPAIVRRGRLVLSAGTGGASPAMAGQARARLGAAFPEAWGEALDEIAAARLALRQAGADAAAIADDARSRLRTRGLID
jgi:precorrin-2 dehydrogenase / sirohydrochlorin ferrochelatase